VLCMLLGLPKADWEGALPACAMGGAVLCKGLGLVRGDTTSASRARERAASPAACIPPRPLAPPVLDVTDDDSGFNNEARGEFEFVMPKICCVGVSCRVIASCLCVQRPSFLDAHVHGEQGHK
jgi:hypothetical protein